MGATKDPSQILQLRLFRNGQFKYARQGVIGAEFMPRCCFIRLDAVAKGCAARGRAMLTLSRCMTSAITALGVDQRGTIAVMMALCAPLIFGFVALATDVASWQVAQKSMQGAADAAAYSAGIAQKNADGTSIVTQAKAVAASQGFVDGVNGVSVPVTQPPASGNYTGTATAIEVIIQQPQTLFFAGLFLSSAPTVQARTVASSAPNNSNGCLIALDSGNPPDVTGIIGAGNGGLNVSGGGTMSLTKCDIFVNARNATSIDITGGGSLSADNITTQGGLGGTATANNS